MLLLQGCGLDPLTGNRAPGGALRPINKYMSTTKFPKKKKKKRKETGKENFSRVAKQKTFPRTQLIA